MSFNGKSQMSAGFGRKVLAFALVALVAAGAGCGLFSKQQEPRLIVPDELLRQSDYAPDGVVPKSRYVVRMSDGQRDWEIEFPEVATGYELRIPLKGEPELAQGALEGPRVTAADREIFQDLAAQTARREDSEVALSSSALGPSSAQRQGNGAGTGRGRAAEGSGADSLAGGSGGGLEPPKVSYLQSVAMIRELFRTRNYEVALVKLVDLERSYPGDEKLLAMKGSLYRELGRISLARQAWEEVLRINPDNEAVLLALEELNDMNLAGRP